MITVKELTKRYGAHTAVDALSFTVDKGQIYGLLGPNGAGKSTTMNIITGYISATDGTAEIYGCDIFDSPAEARAKIGYLPEQPPLYTDMTPREYLAFAAELKGLPREQRKAAVEQCMERTNIADVADRLIRNLSIDKLRATLDYYLIPEVKEEQKERKKGFWKVKKHEKERKDQGSETEEQN